MSTQTFWRIPYNWVSTNRIRTPCIVLRTSPTDGSLPLTSTTKAKRYQNVTVVLWIVCIMDRIGRRREKCRKKRVVRIRNDAEGLGRRSSDIWGNVWPICSLGHSRQSLVQTETFEQSLCEGRGGWGGRGMESGICLFLLLRRLAIFFLTFALVQWGLSPPAVWLRPASEGRKETTMEFVLCISAATTLTPMLSFYLYHAMCCNIFNIQRAKRGRNTCTK